MLSFKRYLQEAETVQNDTSKSTIRYLVVFKIASDVAKDKYQKPYDFKSLFEKLHIWTIELLSNDSWFVVFEVDENFDQSIAKQYRNAVRNTIFEEGELENVTDGIVAVSGFPKHKVNFKSVTLVCEKGSSEGLIWQNLAEIKTLNNLDKYIECEELNIKSAQAVQNGVISIAKIKNLKNLTVSGKNSPWIKFATSAIKTNKNAAQLQTELFKNGLKRYA